MACAYQGPFATFCGTQAITDRVMTVVFSRWTFFDVPNKPSNKNRNRKFIYVKEISSNLLDYLLSI